MSKQEGQQYKEWFEKFKELNDQGKVSLNNFTLKARISKESMTKVLMCAEHLDPTICYAIWNRIIEENTLGEASMDAKEVTWLKES